MSLLWIKSSIDGQHRNIINKNKPVPIGVICNQQPKMKFTIWHIYAISPEC